MHQLVCRQLLCLACEPDAVRRPKSCLPARLTCLVGTLMHQNRDDTWPSGPLSGPSAAQPSCLALRPAALTPQILLQADMDEPAGGLLAELAGAAVEVDRAEVSLFK